MMAEKHARPSHFQKSVAGVAEAPAGPSGRGGGRCGRVSYTRMASCAEHARMVLSGIVAGRAGSQGRSTVVQMVEERRLPGNSRIARNVRMACGALSPICRQVVEAVDGTRHGTRWNLGSMARGARRGLRADAGMKFSFRRQHGRRRAVGHAIGKRPGSKSIGLSMASVTIRRPGQDSGVRVCHLVFGGVTYQSRRRRVGRSVAGDAGGERRGVTGGTRPRQARAAAVAGGAIGRRQINRRVIESRGRADESRGYVGRMTGIAARRGRSEIRVERADRRKRRIYCGCVRFQIPAVGGAARVAEILGYRHRGMAARAVGHSRERVIHLIGDRALNGRVERIGGMAARAARRRRAMGELTSGPGDADIRRNRSMTADAIAHSAAGRMVERWSADGGVRPLVRVAGLARAWGTCHRRMENA